MQGMHACLITSLCGKDPPFVSTSTRDCWDRQGCYEILGLYGVPRTSGLGICWKGDAQQSEADDGARIQGLSLSV